jgi:hypothetical protein
LLIVRTIRNRVAAAHRPRKVSIPTIGLPSDDAESATRRGPITARRWHAVTEKLTWGVPVRGARVYRGGAVNFQEQNAECLVVKEKGGQEASVFARM